METAWRKWPAKAAVALLGVTAIFAAINGEISARLLQRVLWGETRRREGKLFTPPSLDLDSQRRLRQLSLNLGGGRCKWQPPVYEVPEEIDFHKTIITGYPSGDKRMIFVQMEALTGLPAKDEWDFEYLGLSNHPFIKANYPHHEGIWGWGDADQVVMMLRNIRRSMVEYHDILWDIDYAKTWAQASLKLQDLYAERPPIEDFYVWRDLRVMDEAHWYGWHIDYWMEGGLMRDMFTHKITTPEHWNMLTMPTVYTKAEMTYDLIVGNDTVVTPSYDPHCSSGEVSGGCEPIAVISGEKLRDYDDGPAETAKIANVLLNDARTGQYVIAADTWDCIWEELIQNGKGLKTVYDRPGFEEHDYNFSAEMLEKMIWQLDRVIDKYGGSDWNAKATANRIVQLLTEHRGLIQAELDEVNAGTRTLADEDFLGPEERERRRLARLGKGAKGSADEAQDRKDYSGYFQALEQKILEKRRQKMKRLARMHVEANRASVSR